MALLTPNDGPGEKVTLLWAFFSLWNFFQVCGRLTDMSATDDRNTRLDALSAAVAVWATQVTTNLNAVVAQNKQILQGRTGSERLAQSSVAAAQDLVVNEIDAFLVP